MSYNDSVPSAEQTTVCPYNKAHVVLNFRFNNHLIKCRKSYTGEDLETCPFNSSHIIPKPEFYFHKKTCIDRKNILNFIQNNKSDEPKEKKNVKNWDEDEESETKLKTLRESEELSSSISADFNDNEFYFDQFGNKKHKNQGERHGFDEDDNNQTDNRLYSPMSHLHNSLPPSNNQQADQSEYHSDHSSHNDQFASNQVHEDIPNTSERPKKVLRGWSDDEDDVPANYVSSRPKRFENSQSDNRSYRESSTDSFRSNRSHFQQNKFARNYSNGPRSSGSRKSPYNRPHSRQYREMSRESDSNVSTSSRNYQNFRPQHGRSFDRQNSGADERFGSRGSSRSRESSRSRDFRHSVSREPSRSREPSVGYNGSSQRQERRYSTASRYSNDSGSHESHQNHSNGNFGRQNSINFSKYEDEFTKNLENSNKSPEEPSNHSDNEESSHSQPQEPQTKKKLRGWSDDEDDVPDSYRSNLIPPQSPSNFNSSPQNNYISSTSEAVPPVAQKKKLRGWSDDEDDVPPNSVAQMHSSPPNRNDKNSYRNWDDNANEIEYGDKIPITKSKNSRRIFSDRPSDEEILEKFAKLSHFKNFLAIDSWFDKKYRGKMDGNIGMFNWEF